MNSIKNCTLCARRPIGSNSCGHFEFERSDSSCSNFAPLVGSAAKEVKPCKTCAHKACAEDLASAGPNDHQCAGCHNFLFTGTGEGDCGAGRDQLAANEAKCHTKYQLPDGTKNPKDSIGTRKSPTSGIPTIPKRELGLAMYEGALKYGRYNFRVAPVVGMVYTDSAERHIDAWREGEDIDKASGIHHLSKGAADLLLLRDAILMGTWIDDRPPRYPNPADDILDDLNKKAAALTERHQNVCEPYTEVAEAEKRDETTDSYELHKKAFELFLARPDTQETLQKLYEAQFSEVVE